MVAGKTSVVQPLLFEAPPVADSPPAATTPSGLAFIEPLCPGVVLALSLPLEPTPGVALEPPASIAPLEPEPIAPESSPTSPVQPTNGTPTSHASKSFFTKAPFRQNETATPCDGRQLSRHVASMR